MSIRRDKMRRLVVPPGVFPEEDLAVMALIIEYDSKIRSPVSELNLKIRSNDTVQTYFSHFYSLSQYLSSLF
jgi:hypothetical protein